MGRRVTVQLAQVVPPPGSLPSWSPPSALPPPQGMPISTSFPLPVVTPPAVDRTSRHAVLFVWTLVAIVVVPVGGAVMWNVHIPPPSAHRACSQLSQPGLTVNEGKAIISDALKAGVAWQDLHSRCADLVDDFSEAAGP